MRPGNKEKMMSTINSRNPFQKSDDLIKAVEEFDFEKRINKKDLSSDQDLSIAIMNLISIEEHLVFSGAKTKKTKYYDLINDVREMRKELLQKIIKQYEGEEWCICKHLLAASMRLIEVGTKQLNMGRKQDAYDLFEKAFELYSLFWGINMNLIDTSHLKKIPDDALMKDDISVSNPSDTISAKPESSPSKNGIMGALGSLVQKIIDCCIE